MKTNRITRRNFIQKTAVTSGLASLVPIGMSGNIIYGNPIDQRSPREVWIACVSQMGLQAKTPCPPTWPAVQHFGDIQQKYGRKIKITNFHEEEWSIIESLAPEINVMDILKEFNLRTHEELTGDTEKLQIISRQ